MKPNFVKDQEIDLFEEDLLDTKPYVEALISIIDGAEPPFTIGLFGSWGVGKSSIVNSIKSHYDSNKKK